MKSENIEPIDIQIQHCIRFIKSCCAVTKNINRKRSSYGLKHDTERWAGTYISNEAFKAAASQLGLMTASAGTINQYYNIKALKRKRNKFVNNKILQKWD